jgi:hypothetical protein
LKWRDPKKKLNRTAIQFFKATTDQTEPKEVNTSCGPCPHVPIFPERGLIGVSEEGTQKHFVKESLVRIPPQPGTNGDSGTLSPVSFAYIAESSALKAVISTLSREPKGSPIFLDIKTYEPPAGTKGTKMLKDSFGPAGRDPLRGCIRLSTRAGPGLVGVV